MWEYGVDSASLGKDPQQTFCKCGDESSDSQVGFYYVTFQIPISELCELLLH
jgi:hypothetical protein